MPEPLQEGPLCMHWQMEEGRLVAHWGCAPLPAAAGQAPFTHTGGPTPLLRFAGIAHFQLHEQGALAPHHPLRR